MIIGSACVFVLLLDSPGDLTEPVQREQCWSLVRHHQHRLLHSNHLEMYQQSSRDVLFSENKTSNLNLKLLSLSLNLNSKL